MSIYTTLRVTRQKAIDTVAEQIEADLERIRSGSMGDDELQGRLDQILEPRLNNSRIVDADEDNDDDRVYR